MRAYTVDDSGRDERYFDASGVTNDVFWPLFLSGSHLAVEVFVTPRTMAGDDAFDSRTWASLDDVAEARGNILKAQWRGTDEIVLVPALDGQRAVFAIWPHGLSEPRAAVIGANGARVGDVHAFATSEDINRCPAVTPTAHGAFVSFVDSQKNWRLFELDADGAISRKAIWPLPGAAYACPVLTLDGADLALLFDRAGYEEPSNLGVYRMAADGAVAEVTLPSAIRAQHWALFEGEPLLLDEATLSLPLRGESFPVSLPAGVAKRVPSEAGSILLDFDSTDGRRTLVQLTCR